VRQRAGRHKHPTGGCLDSQRVKTTAVPGNRGFDKDKLINGRKRHILVDTTGLLMAVVGTAASVQERDGARLLFGRFRVQPIAAQMRLELGFALRSARRCGLKCGLRCPV